jgi:hypothetical protein
MKMLTKKKACCASEKAAQCVHGRSQLGREPSAVRARFQVERHVRSFGIAEFSVEELGMHVGDARAGGGLFGFSRPGGRDPGMSPSSAYVLGRPQVLMPTSL